MDLVNYILSLMLIAIAFQFGQLWIVFGATLILIVASKDIKVSILFIISLIVLYFINSVGMKEFWLIAMIGLVLLGYLFGLGNEPQQAQDPYASLLGGGMGMG